MTERVTNDLSFGKKLGLAIAGMAALAAPIGVGILNAARLQAQGVAAATQKFEVASIRVCDGTGFAGLKGGGMGGPRWGLHISRTGEL